MAKGDFIEYVVSDDPNKYPNDGEQNGYYYDVFDGSGAYVWKRYSQQPYDVTISVKVVNSGLGLQLSSDDVDLSTVDSSYLSGMYGTYGQSNLPYGFVDATTFMFVSSAGTQNNKNFTYDPTTQIVTLASKVSDSISWGDISKHVDTPYVYAVDDNPSKYPDKSTQDGYYYELFLEGIPIPPGITKFAVDKIKYSSNTSVDGGKALSHSLGSIPRIWILIANELTGSSGVHLYLSIGAASLLSTTYRSGYSLFRNLANNSDAPQGGTPTYPTASQVTIYCGSATYYMKAGVEYTLITMA